MKNEKGITLIALIITIIVMLILVGVTINVALNGGLFEKAENAKNLTQKEVDKEMLLSAVVATVDKSGNFQLDQVQEYLPEGEFTYNTTTKVYTSKNGNKFTINETTGKVEDYVAPNPSPNPDSNTEPTAYTYENYYYIYKLNDEYTLNNLNDPDYLQKRNEKLEDVLSMFEEMGITLEEIPGGFVYDKTSASPDTDGIYKDAIYTDSNNNILYTYKENYMYFEITAYNLGLCTEEEYKIDYADTTKYSLSNGGKTITITDANHELNGSVFTLVETF